MAKANTGSKGSAAKQELLLIRDVNTGEARLQPNRAVLPNGRIASFARYTPSPDGSSNFIELSEEQRPYSKAVDAIMDGFSKNPVPDTIRVYTPEQASALLDPAKSGARKQMGEPITYTMNGRQYETYGFKADVRYPRGDVPGGFSGAEPTDVKGSRDTKLAMIAKHTAIQDAHSSLVRAAGALQREKGMSKQDAYTAATEASRSTLKARIEYEGLYSVGDEVNPRFDGKPKPDIQYRGINFGYGEHMRTYDSRIAKALGIDEQSMARGSKTAAGKGDKFSKGIQATAGAPQPGQAEAEAGVEK